MKTIITLLAGICLVYGSNASGDNVSDRAAYSQSVHRYIASLQSSSLTPERRKALEDLADKDSRFALPAINRPDVFNDHKILIIALNYPARDVQIEAAKHLQDVGTKEDIPAILVAFDKLNQEIIIGGAAAFNNHRRLHDYFILSLASILKITLNKNAPLDEATCDKIVKAAHQVSDSSH